MTGRFSDTLWQEIAPVYAAIRAHPFLRGLTDGTLPEPAFRHYALQDALYLRDFSRALAVAATKAPSDRAIEFFAEQAHAALVVERGLHESFFRGWGLSDGELERAELAPATLAYTSYLLRVALLGSFAELVAALLPCYWIYWEVGRALEAAGSPNELYQRWIDTYASDEFGEVVQRVIALIDQAAAELPASARALLSAHFVTTSRYEWLFWDAAWREERWPI